MSEAAVHSYQHVADSIQIKGQTITKTTVMNKVHSVEKEIPQIEKSPEKKKACEYLYIEADEDHIHRQKDGKIRDVSRENGSISLKEKKRSVKVGGN